MICTRREFVGGLAASPWIPRQDRKIGFALVGLGYLATNQIAPALQKTRFARLAAVVTGTPEKEKLWADTYGLAKSALYTYRTFDRLVEDKTVDAVYLALPNGLHAEYAVRAARAGKHVLCEKPMAVSSKECTEMIDACAGAGVKLSVGYRCRFEPHHVECIRLAREKVFGELRLIEAGFGFAIGDPRQWRLNKRLAGGGALMDVGLYALQACRVLSGREPLSVTAVETKTDDQKFKEVDETIVWSMKFPDGLIADCTTTYKVNGINRFRAMAENGWFGLDPAFSYGGLKGATSKGPLAFEPTDHFAAEIDDFADCILNAKPSRVPGEEGRRDLKVIEAIYRSIDTGRAVTLE